MIEFIGAGKDYGGKWGVRGLDLAIQKGEIFGLLGPNGAGKTTAIRMMTGLVRPSEGRVLIGGYDMAQSPVQAKALIGYVPDKSFLYEKLTSREFMHFVASLYGVPDDAARARTAELLGVMGIADVAEDLIESYSHGMRQRLLFAAALIHEPPVLVIDEPFVGLDPYGVRAITKLMAGLAGGGTAVFLATHSLHIAGDLCGRVGIIHKGRLAHLMRKEDYAGGMLEARFIEATS